MSLSLSTNLPIFKNNIDKLVPPITIFILITNSLQNNTIMLIMVVIVIINCIYLLNQTFLN